MSMRHKALDKLLNFAVLFTFLTVFYAGAIEIKDLHIAVIWNKGTSSQHAPWGWKVGSTTKGEDTEAPEIAKAQLKLLLASFDSNIKSTSTLDTVGIPDNLFDGNGIPSGPYKGLLKNVRIYSTDDEISYAKIKSDFGKKPSSILYINGGVLAEDEGVYQTLRDAASDEVGIMSIGDVSATEAEHIDTTGRTFPVMGVQKWFHFKASEDGDLIREFQFLTDNDLPEKIIPDTVDLYAGADKDGDGNPDTAKILLKRGGKPDSVIYQVHFNGTNPVLDFNRTILPDSAILTQYGEWSIKAQAVEVIDDDLYAPEMTIGVQDVHDGILVSRNNSVYVAKANWGPNIMANGQVVAKRGEELPNIKSYGSTQSDGSFKLDKDYVIAVKNIQDVSQTDSICILKAGDVIDKATTDNTDDLSGGTYIDYIAGGYKDLKIEYLDTVSRIYEEVFPTLKASGVKTLMFKPWTKDGRIEADADIWAFNEQLKLGSFDSIYNGATFDSSTYYVAYLANQLAGTANDSQFIKPPEKLSDFDLTFEQKTLDSLGYNQDQKLYHVISVAQKNHRRLAMLNFQPTYLENQTDALALLKDATIWISVDDFKLPTPDIQPSDGTNIFTDFDTLVFLIDFKLKGTGLKKESYKFSCDVTYAGTTKTYEYTVPADDGTKGVDTISFTLSQLGIDIDSTDTSNVTLNIDATVEPVSLPASFEGSETKATFNIYQLEKPRFLQPSSTFKGASYNDTLVSDSTTAATTGQGDSTANISGVTINATIGSSPDTGSSPFGFSVTADGTVVTAFASKARYVNSKLSSRTYVKNASDLNIEKAYYKDTSSIPDGYADIIHVVLDQASLDVVTSGSVSMDNIAGFLNGKLILPSDLTVGNFMAVSDGFVIAITEDMSVEPNTAVDSIDTLNNPSDVTVDAGIVKSKKVPIEDSVAPVIVTVKLFPSDDSLTVKFSEKVKKPDISNQIFKFTDYTGKEYIVNIEAVISGNSVDDEFTFSIKSITDLSGSNVVTPVVGDSVQLLGSVGLEDISGNKQSSDTKKVSLLIDKYKIGINNAYYLDTNVIANGYIDQVVVVLNDYTQGLLANTALGLTTQDIIDTLNNQGLLSLISDKGLTVVDYIATSDGFVINVQADTTVEPNTAVNGTDKLIDKDLSVINDVAVLPADTIAIADSLAPVIVKVVFDPNNMEDPADSSKGKLIVKFSEGVQTPNNISSIIKFNDKTIDYTMNFVLDSSSSDMTTFFFTVNNIIGKTYPEDKDTAKIGINSGITDLTGNVQNNAMDPVVIEVGKYINKTKLGVITPFIPNVTNIGPILKLYNLDDKGLSNTGTLLIIKISGAITDKELQDGAWGGDAVIYDAVGNVVNNIDLIFAKNKNSGEMGLVGVWDGKNKNGRVVGSGSYLMTAVGRKYGEVQFTQNSMIAVSKESSE